MKKKPTPTQKSSQKTSGLGSSRKISDKDQFVPTTKNPINQHKKMAGA